jgi:hypothetical protein
VKHYLLLLFTGLFCFVGTTLWAQDSVDATPASLPLPITNRLPQDSLLVKKDTTPIFLFKPVTYPQLLQQHPYFNFLAAPTVQSAIARYTNGKEVLFYIFCALVFLLALVRAIFAKYFKNLFVVAFGASLKQKQIREQLLQNPIASLLLNILFVLVAGLYISFLKGQQPGYNGDAHFWQHFLYAITAIASIYCGKFIVLKFTAWVFNIKEAINVYIFIVFLINKLIGIFLLPIIIFMSFTTQKFRLPLITTSYVLIGALLAYRYIVSYIPVKREVKVSQFHFFLYICAFEIVPMVVLYRAVHSNFF